MQATQAVQISNEQQIVSSVGALCAAAGDMLIISREDVSEATDLVKVIKTRARDIEGERTGLVKPLNDTVDKINGRFKAILQPLKAAEEELKAKMLSFQLEENRKAEVARKEAQRKADEEAARIAEENKGPPIEVPVAVIAAVPPKTTYGQFGGSSTVKKVWAYELVDITALAVARPDLVTIDAGKINAEIRGRGGVIDGLRIFEKEIMSIR